MFLNVWTSSLLVPNDVQDPFRNKSSWENIEQFFNCSKCLRLVIEHKNKFRLGIFIWFQYEFFHELDLYSKCYIFQVNVYKQPVTDLGKKSKKGRLTLEYSDGQYKTVEEGKGDPKKVYSMYCSLLETKYETNHISKCR